MKGKNPSRNFGGRPVQHEPEAGKRTHLSLAVPLSLKQRLEQEAAKRGWSVSAEATHRLEQSLDGEPFSIKVQGDEAKEFVAALRGLFEGVPQTKGSLDGPIATPTKRGTLKKTGTSSLKLGPLKKTGESPSLKDRARAKEQKK